MKKTLLLLLTLFTLTVSQAATDGCPFAMPSVTRPMIPERAVLLTEYGAVPDGGTLCTEAFRRAMLDLGRQGGGRLIVPPGIWLTGPIQFEDNCELHVQNGALVLFTADFDAYPMVETVYEGKKSTRKMAPLWAYEKHDVAITGEGAFDGQGQYWRPSKKVKFTESQWANLTSGAGIEMNGIWYPDAKADSLAGRPGQPDMRRVLQRPVLLEFTRCRRVLLQDATFSNSPAWNVHPLMCDDITIDHITVRNPWYAQNGDGLDLESARRAIVRNCTFDVGDDAICIKSGKDAEGRSWKRPCQYVIIEGCTVLHGHGGFVIGSEMSSGAHHIWVHNCVFNGTDTGLRMKSTRGRGGVVEDIFIDHIYMVNISGDAFTFDLYYSNKPVAGQADKDTSSKDAVPPVTEETPSFRNLYISDITCQGASRAIWFNGLPEMPLDNLVMTNSQFTCTRGAEMHYAKNIFFDNVTINNSEGEQFIIDKTVQMAGQYASRTSGWEDNRWQLRGTLSASRGHFERHGQSRQEVNASGELTLLRYVGGNVSAGVSSGYYRSVGPKGINYVPVLALVHYDFPVPINWVLRPNAEVNGGYLLGVGRGQTLFGDGDYPNCFTWGLRMGLNYQLPSLDTLFGTSGRTLWRKCRPTLSGGFNLSRICDGTPSIYNTAEWNFGLYGGVAVFI